MGEVREKEISSTIPTGEYVPSADITLDIFAMKEGMLNNKPVLPKRKAELVGSKELENMKSILCVHDEATAKLVPSDSTKEDFPCLD